VVISQKNNRYLFLHLIVFSTDFSEIVSIKNCVIDD
jgi:hypothetical protein